MRYVNARLDEEARELTYRTYITDSLQNIPQNKYLTRRFFDIIKPNVVDDNRSGDEIAMDIISRMGLTAMENGSDEINECI